MFLVSNLSLPLDYDEEYLKTKVAKTMGVSPEKIEEIKLFKRSIDARKELRYVASVLVTVTSSAKVKPGDKVATYKPYEYIQPAKCDQKRKVFVIGAGPCGLFAALTLAKSGLRPVVMERGKSVEERQKSVDDFTRLGVLDENSNVQFGEGGAGTFSDGKLNTGTHDERIRYVLDTFVSAGAPEEIAFESAPHVGTDILKKIVKNIREEIKALGGEFLFDARFCGFEKKQGKITAIKYEMAGKHAESECDAVVLATGHSARDVYRLLFDKGVALEPKPFSLGARIEHLKSDVDRAQFKREGITATYKLSTHLPSGRGVYTFCMCPGGVVIAAASEKGGVVTNGMSYHARDGKNSNSALLVGVTPEDWGNTVLGGIELQRKHEKLAYEISSSYRAPSQTVEDFLHGRKTTGFGKVVPSYLPGVVPSDLSLCLPDFVVSGMKTGIVEFGKKLKGFDDGEAVLTGVETRSSAPVRILRTEKGYSPTLTNLYPSGEGAGYAGGITSSAVDGIKTAEKIIAAILSNEL